MISAEARTDEPKAEEVGAVSPFRQDPLSRLYVRVSTALAILEDGSYGLLQFEDAARLLVLAVGDIDELKLAKGERPATGISWNEYPALSGEPVTRGEGHADL